MLLVGLWSLAASLVILATVARVHNPVPFAVSVVAVVLGLQAIAAHRLMRHQRFRDSRPFVKRS